MLTLFLIGIGAGLLAGLLGVGGGVLMVPVLVGLGVSPIQAFGTSNLAIVITSIAGLGKTGDRVICKPLAFGNWDYRRSQLLSWAYGLLKSCQRRRCCWELLVSIYSIFSWWSYASGSTDRERKRSISNHVQHWLLLS
nr:TSUP family transporter [Synechococcus elongatus]